MIGIYVIHGHSTCSPPENKIYITELLLWWVYYGLLGSAVLQMPNMVVGCLSVTCGTYNHRANLALCRLIGTPCPQSRSFDVPRLLLVICCSSLVIMLLVPLLCPGHHPSSHSCAPFNHYQQYKLQNQGWLGNNPFSSCPNRQNCNVAQY